METYRSEPTTINSNINTIYEKLTQPERFKVQIEANLDRLPPEARDNIGKLSFGADSITIDSPMGPVKISLAHDYCREPEHIVFTAAQSPVPFNLAIDLAAISETETRAEAMLQVELPFFLKAMVGKQLKEGAQQFGKILAMLPYEEM